MQSGLQEECWRSAALVHLDLVDEIKLDHLSAIGLEQPGQRVLQEC